jgi:Flp pilus assembly CpaE family ATPase
MISLLSAKGGSGVSLVSTNLGVCWAAWESCILIDMHLGLGCDDLLLDLPYERSWADLLPVAFELKPRHLDLACSMHPSGLGLLCAPDRLLSDLDANLMETLVTAVVEQVDMVLLDFSVGIGRLTNRLLPLSDAVLLVVTADPGSLRAASRMMAALPESSREKLGLVINQTGRRHPADPKQVANALGIPLLAALPADPRAVGYQVNFGHPCVSDRRSVLGRAIRGLARRLHAARHLQPLGKEPTLHAPRKERPSGS